MICFIVKIVWAICFPVPVHIIVIVSGISMMVMIVSCFTICVSALPICFSGMGVCFRFQKK